MCGTACSVASGAHRGWEHNVASDASPGLGCLFVVRVSGGDNHDQ